MLGGLQIYSKKTHITSLLTLLNVGLNVGLNIPLIMKFGAVGAAWATMLAGIISGTVSLVVAQHYYRIHYEWNKISWIMGTFFTGASIIITMNLFEVSYFWSLSVKCVVVIIFIAHGVRYGLLTKENYNEFRSALYIKKFSQA